MGNAKFDNTELTYVQSIVQINRKKKKSVLLLNRARG
jgi:hypothetical protein